MTVFVKERHPKRGLKEAGRIEKGGERDRVERTGLGTHVPFGPGWDCAWSMRSAWQEARSPSASHSENSGACRGYECVCMRSGLHITFLLLLPQLFKDLGSSEVPQHKSQCRVDTGRHGGARPGIRGGRVEAGRPGKRLPQTLRQEVGR